MRLTEYGTLTAVQMASMVCAKTVSPVDLVQAALEAIETTDGALNAWCEVLATRALEQAFELEGEAQRGSLRGPLHGVPVGVKDLFLTAGVPTRRGSRLYADHVPVESAPCVERMINAGAIMVGKTTTPETGWKASSTSPLYGVTRNPWDVGKTAGGSSSGSAVCVAAGTVPIALGSDGGGSVRIPASFCGIFSMKATLGRVPVYPLSPSEYLSHAGPMTNTVADTALAFNVLKGPDPRDPLSLPNDGLDWLASLQSRPRTLRCALVPTLFGRKIDGEIAECIASSFATIEKMHGIDVVEATLDWQDPVTIFDQLWIARGALYRAMPAADKARLDPGLARLIASSETVGLDDHFRALQARARFCRTVGESFREFDLLVMPMLPVQPFAAEAEGPLDMDPSAPVPWARWTPFSYPFNITGQPAASIPCGWTSKGLPVGMQVVGGRFADLTVLQFCAQWEREFDWHSRRPAVHAGG